MQQLKSIRAELQELSQCLSRLKNNTQQLKDTFPGVQRFTEDVQRDIKKWQFKTQPRLNRIQIILDVLKIDQKNK